MTKTEFLDEVRSVFDDRPESLTGGETLSELGWSSLSAVDFIALCDEKCNTIVEVEKLRECKTVNDLAALVPLS